MNFELILSFRPTGDQPEAIQELVGEVKRGFDVKCKFLRFFIVVLSFSFFVFRSSLSVKAADNFSITYDVTYEVKEKGITTVTQNIRLTNLTTKYYASEYTLTFGTEKIEEISAWDGAGPLKVEISKGTGLTQIQVVFNEKVVGQGKTLNWTLRFTSPEIAQKLGRIWEINIPRLTQEEKVSSYNVSLIVPESFGQPVYIYPPPKNSSYFWSLPESRQGISLGFGDWQGFRFDLSYHLENTQMVPKTMEIALPPDTPYQKITLNKIDPPPLKTVVDEDGNWLAKYALLPKQKREIKVNGFAQVYLSPRPDYPRENVDKIPQEYLRSQKYWEVDDSEIRQLANELKTPEAIYNYVVSTLTYDYQRASSQASRFGAKQALANPDKAICMEFTDLFIALARAAGIPAREVDGFAYTSNSRLKPLSLVADVLHAWPEYFDREKNIWVQVDPTWGKTSFVDYFNRFDFNHLAFVKRGIDSTSPYPAGSYKGATGGKDVSVDFLTDFPLPTSSFPKIQLPFPKWVIAGLPLSGSLKIKNENNQALYNQRLTLTSSYLGPKVQEFKTIILPPSGEETFPVKLENSNMFAYGKNILTLTIDEQKTEIAFQIIPLPLLLIPAVLGFFVSILLICLIVKKIWMRFLPRL